MALRGTLTHRKTRRLARLLEIDLCSALGILEALWHVTGEQFQNGDISSLSAQDLADEMFYEKDADVLLSALFKSEWLTKEVRGVKVYVKGWDQHADAAVCAWLLKRTLLFANGAIPRMPHDAFNAESRRRIEAEYHRKYPGLVRDESQESPGPVPDEQGSSPGQVRAYPEAEPDPVPVPVPVPVPGKESPTLCVLPWQQRIDGQWIVFGEEVISDPYVTQALEEFEAHRLKIGENGYTLSKIQALQGVASVCKPTPAEFAEFVVYCCRTRGWKTLPPDALPKFLAEVRGDSAIRKGRLPANNSISAKVESITAEILRRNGGLAS